MPSCAAAIDDPAHYEEELRTREAAVGLEHPDVAETCGNLAILYNQKVCTCSCTCILVPQVHAPQWRCSWRSPLRFATLIWCSISVLYLFKYRREHLATRAFAVRLFLHGFQSASLVFLLLLRALCSRLESVRLAAASTPPDLMHARQASGSAHSHVLMPMLVLCMHAGRV